LSVTVRATLIGFSAILIWSLLSVLTVLSGTVPPFQLAAMTFATGGTLGAATLGLSPRRGARLPRLRDAAQNQTAGSCGCGQRLHGS
jgi:hypothetical protein